jgi:hypothetical protein
MVRLEQHRTNNSNRNKRIVIMATAEAKPAVKAEKPAAIAVRDERKLFDGRTATAMFYVDVWHLRCVMGAMGKDDVRSYINGLYLDLGVVPGDYSNAQLVATNGHIICRCPVTIDKSIHQPVLQEFLDDRSNNCTKLGLSHWQDLIFRPQVVPPKHGHMIYFDLKNGAYWSDRTGKDWALSLIDGRYPDWRRVCAWEKKDFVQEDKPRSFCVNFKYINQMFPDDSYVIISQAKDMQGATRLEPNDPRLEGVYASIMEAKPKNSQS